MTENWKTITDYPDYEISDLGNVRSIRNDIILKPRPQKNGYVSVQLYRNKKSKTHNIHRLVATAFISNPDNRQLVNHKDGDKTNNVHTNLEWVNHSENLIHSYGSGLHNPYWKDKSGSDHNKSKTVLQFSKTGEYLNEFGSAHEAKRMTGVNMSNITMVCRGKRRFAGGFIWKYA